MSGTRWVRAALCVAVAACVAGEPLALARVRMAAVGPVMTIVTDPPSPDGSNGWFSTPPEIKMLSDVDATGWWSWNAGAPDWAPLTAGVPAFIGDAPEGLSDLAVSGVDASGTPGATVTASFMVDSIAPGTPGNFTAVAGPGVVDLAWDASVEAGSGLVGYTVYRNTVGAPFQLTDVVASTPATTWTDVAPPVADFVYYAVSARDTAGWESVLTAEAATTPDSAPPTDPGDLEAWLNASNWVRVSWLPSLDTGSGLSHYVVLRSLDGGPFEDIAHVGAGTAFYDDHDDQVLFASTVEYEVYAVDRVGLESGIAGPVPMQSDTVAPSPPSALAVTPVYSGTFTDAEFDLTWTGGADGGSGVASTELQWGPVAAAPNHAARVSDGSERVAADSETALLYFRMRSEDRAGNLSAFGMSVPARNVAAERVGGATRIQTAIAASAASFDSAATVVIASAASYPDALCSNALAGTVDGPVLLVGSGPLPPGTLAEIARLGATDAYVVGGVAAVSPETEASLAGAVPGTVERVAGRDRYETAAEVARKVSDIGGGVPPEVAFVVSANSFADALSVGPVSWSGRAPVLYANQWAVPAATTEALGDIGAARCIIVGGVGAVTSAADTSLPGAERIAGDDRYATNRAFGRWAVAEFLADADHPALVTGSAYADGLVAGPLAGSRGSLVLLVSDTQAGAVGAWLAPYRSTLGVTTTLGGTGVVSEIARTTVWAAVSVP